MPIGSKRVCILCVFTDYEKQFYTANIYFSTFCMNAMGNV